jgi:hypothetical protein
MPEATPNAIGMSKHSQQGKLAKRGGKGGFHTAKAFEFAARNGGKNPKAVRLRTEPSGDGNDYREIAVRAFRGSEAIADMVVGLDAHGNLRVVCTADGEGDGDHAVALFPELPAGEMVRRTVCDLDRAPEEYLKRSVKTALKQTTEGRK